MSLHYKEPIETTKLLTGHEEGMGDGVDEPDGESFVSHILVSVAIGVFEGGKEGLCPS